MFVDSYGQTSGSNCDSSETIEATLTVDAAAHDGSFDNAGGLDYFQIDPATDIDVIMETTFTNNNLEYSLQLCDSNDNLIASDRNDNQNISVFLVPGTYYIVVGSSGADQYQLRVITDTRDSTSFSDCEDLTTSFPEDPLYGCQWHLKNTGQWRFNGQRITAGEDINIEGVWNDEIFGNGINVAVIDTGLDFEHEDLAANVNSDLNHDYTGNNNVFTPDKDGHGTNVAGVIAAVGDNGVGIRGVAPQASIYNYNLTLRNGAYVTSANKADAMTRNRTTTAVSNNSWSAGNPVALYPAGRVWELAVETGIREGFGGKGVFYSWAAANSHLRGGQANFREYSNYYAVTNVCSTDGSGRKSPFSEEGVNVWICAPGSDITTTYNNDRYGENSGTSFSTPIVSGVAALMREVNSDLSWRDLKLIFAASVRKNDPTDPDWETVAVKYGSETENYNYNPKYGFGVVDAAAAVELARSWTTVPPMRTLTASADNIEIEIPDHTGGADGEITSRLNVPDGDLFTEFVEINLNFTHNSFPDLNIQITSPDGTVSQLTEEYGGGGSYTDKTHRFGSAKHLGEDPAGEWTLRISDTDEGHTGTLHSWSIKVYGHRSGDTVPTFGSETITDKEYYATVTATTETLPEATGGDGTLTYSITPALPAGLNFNTATREISGTPTTATGKTTYTYTVTDADGDTDELTFGITVGADIPIFGNETITDKEYVTGTAITEVLPETAGGDGTLRYSLTPALPAGLNFNASTREISGTPTTATGKTTYTYTVTDDDGDTDQITFGITVETDSVPTFGSETITEKKYVISQAVTEMLPLATGGNVPLRYSITPPLPVELRFNSNTRVISGRPERPALATIGTYTYTVEDKDGDTDELTFIINFQRPSKPKFGRKITDKKYITGTAVTEILPGSIGGNYEVRHRLTPALPAGLTFNSSTAVIRGTLTTATPETTYTYSATDYDGDKDELTFSITVETDSIPDFSDTITDKEYVTGTAVTETLPGSIGGNYEVRHRLTPALPAGLTFNSSTAVIRGTLTTATPETTYTYSATDYDGDKDELTFSITVETDSIPDFSDTITDKEYVTGTAVTETLPAAIGGNYTVRYSLTPALPAGLSFNAATRVISGTPTRASSATYTYTATDRNRDTAKVSFILRVTDPPDRKLLRPGPDNGSGGGGGCALSDQNSIVSDIFGVMACLMLIPASVVIRRKRISHINT